MKIKMKDLRVGMKVKLKKNLVAGRIYGKESWVYSMKQDTIVTISHINSSEGLFKIAGEPQKYNYTPKMVKKIVVSFEDLKVGMKVKLKKNLFHLVWYGDAAWRDEMLKDTIVTIESLNSACKSFNIAGDSARWYYTPKMIKKIVVEEEQK